MARKTRSKNARASRSHSSRKAVKNNPRSKRKSTTRRTPRRAPKPEPTRRQRQAARLLAKPKSTYQVTDLDIKERKKYLFSKGRKHRSRTESASAILETAKRDFKKSASRRSSTRYTARIHLRWKSKSGKWQTRTLYQVSDTLDKAVAGLLKNPEINSNTYETKDGVQKRIHSKHKYIAGVSFDKYSYGRISRTSFPKKKNKKSRGL